MSEIYYARVDEFWKKEEKYRFLEEKKDISDVDWKIIIPDKKYNWLTEGLSEEFETFLPMGTKSENEAVFITYSIGTQTGRDSWAYNFSKENLAANMKRHIESYNAEVDRRHGRSDKKENLDDFVLSDGTKIKWSSRLKESLLRNQKALFSDNKIRKSLYRPFCMQFLFFDEIMTHRQGKFSCIFPTEKSESENSIICVNQTSERPFCSLITDKIPNLVMCGGFGASTQCFPLYTYSADGTDRRENITDWALQQFISHYRDDRITKSDIFYYIYGLLHHPEYRKKYAANLKRELPRIPFAPDFQGFAEAGKRLADLHLNYKNQPEYPLVFTEKENTQLNWKVEKMKFSKDKTSLIYNNFFTLSGIPPETYEYRLGNRSALEWIVDQYQIKTDKRSGIVNDPNQQENPKYILQLIGKIIFISLETVKIIKSLPARNH